VASSTEFSASSGQSSIKDVVVISEVNAVPIPAEVEHRIQDRSKQKQQRQHLGQQPSTKRALSTGATIRQGENANNTPESFKLSTVTVLEVARRLLIWVFICSFSDEHKREVAMLLFKSTSPKDAENNKHKEEFEKEISLKTSKELNDMIFEASIDKERLKLLVLFVTSSRGKLGDMNTAIRMMCKAGQDMYVSILNTIFPNAAPEDIKKEIGARRKTIMGTALELFTALAFPHRKATLRNYIEEEHQDREHRRQGHDFTVGEIYVNCRVEGCYMSGAPKGSPFHMKEEDRKRLRQALQEHARTPTVNAKPELAKNLAEKLIAHMKNDKAYDLLVWMREVDNQSKSHFYLVQCKARANPEEDNVDVRKYSVDITSLQSEARRLDCLAPLFFCSTINCCRRFLKEFNGSLHHDVSIGCIIPWLLLDICNDDKELDLVRKVFLALINMDLPTETSANNENAPPPMPVAMAPLPPPQSLPPRSADHQESGIIAYKAKAPPKKAFATTSKPPSVPQSGTSRHEEARKPMAPPMRDPQVPPAEPIRSQVSRHGGDSVANNRSLRAPVQPKETIAGCLTGLTAKEPAARKCTRRRLQHW
jgi:hypothetical protein